MENITVSHEELEQIVFEEVMKTQHILFDMCLEDYVLLPEIKENKRKGQIMISKQEWEKFLERIDMGFNELERARQLIGNMEPVYLKYRDEYARSHEFNLDHYAKMVTVDYSAEEFERVRDQFEDEFYKKLNNEEEYNR